MSKISAIVLSAGKGKRMNTDVSKQYIEVFGKPVICYTLKAFEESDVDEIILVTGAQDTDYVKQDIVEKYGISKVKHIVSGGAERYDSVINGLELLEESDKVLIHDGARPLIKPEQINQIIEEIKVSKACIAGMPVKDTIKLSDETGYVRETPLREYVWQIQTPQAFDVSVVKSAYQKMREANDTSITDDAMAVEKYTDTKIKLVRMDYENIKITTMEDLLFLKQVLEQRGMTGES